MGISSNKKFRPKTKLFVLNMARMYSRGKGKSGSKKPIKKTLPTWLRYKSKEAELLILKLAKEGKTSAEIGTILRDTYGIPNVRLLIGRRIGNLLKEKNLLKDLPEDILSLIRRDVKIIKHIEKNKHDENAKRGKILTESKINRLVKYYKRTGRLPTEWRYDPKRASILAE